MSLANFWPRLEEPPLRPGPLPDGGSRRTAITRAGGATAPPAFYWPRRLGAAKNKEGKYIAADNYV